MYLFIYVIIASIYYFNAKYRFSTNTLTAMLAKILPNRFNHYMSSVLKIEKTGLKHCVGIFITLLS